MRGAGYFQAIELVKDKETKESFNDEESEKLLRGFLSAELYKRGLICRADDRGDPVIQLSPPLIAGPEQFADLVDEWVSGGASDGFTLQPATVPEDLELFVDHVVPILQDRGLFRREYEGVTLRDHLGLSRP